MLDLKDFVKKTIQDLLEATNELNSGSEREVVLMDTKDSRTVEFDIAVVAENSSGEKGEVKGGAGVKVLGLLEFGGGANHSGTAELKNVNSSRIKFGIYIDRETKQEIRSREAANAAYNRQRSEEYI